MNRLSLLPVLAAVCLGAVAARAGEARVQPAPSGEELSSQYTVAVEGRPAPVYSAHVAPASPEARWKAMDDKARSAEYFGLASFASFDMRGPVTVTVTCAGPVRSVRALPASFNLSPVIEGRQVRLTLSEPRPVTLEFNGAWTNALHLFANPFEEPAPAAGASNVIFFGPGVHEISRLVVRDNQTVYVAGGAVVRGIVKPDEKYRISGYSGLRTYSPTLELRGTNITLRGRGIIDGGLCPTHARNLLWVQGRDIRIEGVVLRNSSTWTVPVRKSDRVRIQNIKLIGCRANSDGIDICNSRDVLVEDCFIRTLDDLIVIKTDQGQGEARDITARRCVLWNEVAHALSVGAELRENASNILFQDCDVIHDLGREWTLRVYHCDAARVSGIRFENIRVEESQRLASVWIGSAVWSRDAQRGQVSQVLFKDIQARGAPLRVELKGADAQHRIEEATFQNVTLNSKPLLAAEVKTNAFVGPVTVTP